MADTIPILSGYQILNCIYDGHRTLIYQAQRETDQQPVVIKFLKNDYPAFHELVQFRNQYTITKNLDIEGIIHPYAIEKYKNGYAIVMEDLNMCSLHDYVTSHPLMLHEFFDIAITLTYILEDLYKNRIIHKDIKPQNILIHPETKQVKLIDFSISSLLPRETQEIRNPNKLEGTLAYVSPEQTGRMNRGVDYRTDFYSLGVTFYELLSGRLPFQSEDVMELVHCHIAKTPTPLVHIKRTIPQVINDIVMKLMAKTAEERYQSVLGLRHDLKICQQQWEKQGDITPFPLGQRDISDRFHIPEKLYGREAEVEILLTAFERVSAGTTEMMLVAGFSGIGKTALVNEVHKPIVRQRGYFIKGKFDQFKRDIPFSAFVQAFQSLLQQLLTETDQQVQTWKTQLLEALGTNGQVIINVLPELEQILGKQPPVPDIEGNAAQNRFNLLFQRFIQVFTTASHPLVIFLDDLQWVDSASLKLIELLMERQDGHYLLLIGAYRDNEVGAAHPLILTLEEIRKTQALVNQITLGPLAHTDLNDLVADTLCCPIEKALPLTELVLKKTQGNPFFTDQFLRFLHAEQLITFDLNCGHWQCDLTQVKLLTVSDNVVEFMAHQLRRLPTATQRVLKLAACIGHQFDLALLAIVHEKSQMETATDLWKALQEGLILPISEVYKFFQSAEVTATEKIDLSVPYKFLHDRVQQAAYSLIAEEQKPATHLKIGRLLKQSTPADALDARIFDIVNQLNLGLSLITEPAEQDELVHLNLQAGQKAKASTAYGAATRYLAAGLELLPADGWQTHYELTLALYELANEVAYLNGDFERQGQLAEIILNRAQSLLDKVKTYEIQIRTCWAQGLKREALDRTLPILEQLGVKFPEQINQTDTERYLQDTQLTWREKPINSLGDLPPMTNKTYQAAMRLLSLLTGPVYEVAPELFVPLICEGVQISTQHGNCSESAFSYACYGFIQAGMDHIETGYQFGQLAYKILEEFNAREYEAKVADAVMGYTNSWKISFKDTLKPLQEAYQAGLEFGDFEYVGNCSLQYCVKSYHSGQELYTLEIEMAGYIEMLQKLKQETTIDYNQIFRQSVLNLLGKAKNPSYLIGTVYNEEEKLPIYQQRNDIFALYLLYSQKIFLSYLFQAYQQTIDCVALADSYLSPNASFALTPSIYFCDSLARLALYPRCAKAEQQAHLDKVHANQAKMQNWAKHAPMNYQHKFDLVEAERYHVLGDYVNAMDFYDRAIAGAKENEFLHEEAIANEVAARFYLSWNKDKIAQIYLVEAYYAYARWGAKAKVEDLETRYPELLAPILASETPRDSTYEPTRSSSRIKPTKSTLMPTSRGTVAVTRSTRTDFLDLATVMKSSLTISEEIVFEQLLQKLMRIVLENAGAQRGVLILERQGQFWVEAEAHIEDDYGITLQTVPLEKASERLIVPLAIVNTVIRNKTPLVLNEVTRENSLAKDSYILEKQPKSVLALPILYHGRLTGVLYLEHALVSNAFTFDRLTVLKLLSTQIAISLENAQTLATLDGKVTERTAQLNTKVEELTKTRHELIQSEKMASLGRLVAGFAHELNTPIGVAVGTASTLRRKTTQVQQLLKQEEVDEEELVGALEKIDEAAELTLSNLRRAAGLVNSFKRTAVDQTSGDVRKFKVKATLEDMITALNNQFRQTAIKIQLECPEDLAIYSVPGSLEQVLTNLMMNSLIHGFEGGKQSGHIFITCHLENDRFHMTYADDGKGIAPGHLEKIFEPFFTTHRAHGGSGLGMYICYNLITNQLNGTMTCESTLGSGVLFKIEFPVMFSLPDSA